MKRMDSDAGMDFDDQHRSKNVDQSSTPGIKVGGNASDSMIDVESIHLTDEGDGDENFRSVDL